MENANWLGKPLGVVHKRYESAPINSYITMYNVFEATFRSARRPELGNSYLAIGHNSPTRGSLKQWKDITHEAIQSPSQAGRITFVPSFVSSVFRFFPGLLCFTLFFSFFLDLPQRDPRREPLFFSSFWSSPKGALPPCFSLFSPSSFFSSWSPSS